MTDKIGNDWLPSGFGFSRQRRSNTLEMIIGEEIIGIWNYKYK